MKRKSVLVAAIFLLVGVLYAAPLQEGAAGGSGELVLLHTNDHHGAVLPSNGLGGLEEIASVVKGIKAVNTNVLLVDAGDLNTGSALSNMFNAEPDILAYNIMGYDAITFGNHEFDGTQEKLDKQISLAGFPFVSSNIKTQDGAFLGGNQYIVKKFGNVKVGVFGITTTHAEAIASTSGSNLQTVTCRSSKRTKSRAALLALPCMNHRRNAPPYSNPAIRVLNRKEGEVGRRERIRTVSMGSQGELSFSRQFT